MLRALVSLSSLCFADAFSHFGGKPFVGSRPILAPHLSRTLHTAGYRLHARQSLTPAKLVFDDSVSVTSADTTDFVVDLFNFLGEYNTLVGFTLCLMAFWFFAKPAGPQKERGAKDFANYPQTNARFKSPSQVTNAPKDNDSVDIVPGLATRPEDTGAARTLLGQSKEEIKLQKPEGAAVISNTRFGFRRRISAVWNRFRTREVEAKAMTKEDTEQFILKLDALKERLQKTGSDETKMKLALAAERQDADIVSTNKYSSSSDSANKPGPIHLPKAAPPAHSKKRFRWLGSTLGKLWNGAKTVGKALKPPNAYLANMVLVTGLTGGMLSTTMIPSSAIGNTNGRLSAHGHTVVLADKVDEKVLKVLCGMAHEAASSNDAKGELRRGVVVMTPQDRITTHQQIQSRLEAEWGAGLSGKPGEGRRAEKLDIVTRQGDPTVMEDLNNVCIKDASHVVWVKHGAKSHDSAASTSRTRNLIEAGSTGGVAFASPPLAGAWKKTAREAALLRELRGNQDVEEDDLEVRVTRKRSPSAPILVFSNEGENSGNLGRAGGRDFVHVKEMATSEAVLRKAALQPTAGMAMALNELLGGDVVPLNSEPVSQACPWLMGRPFSEVQASFSSVVVCGIIRGEDVFLSPPQDTWISPFDRIVAIGSSKRGMPKASEPHFPSRSPSAQGKQAEEAAGFPKVQEQVAQGLEGDVLVLNWNAMGESVVEELRSATRKGAVKVMSQCTSKEQFGLLAENLVTTPGRAGVELYKGDTDDPVHLERVGMAQCKVIVVLPDADQGGRVDSSSDASLLRTVQGLANVKWEQDQEERPRVVGMVHSPTMLSLLRLTCQQAGLPSDFVLSEQVEGGLATKVMLRPEMKAVMADMVDAARLVPLEAIVGSGCDGRRPVAMTLKRTSPGLKAPVKFEGNFKQLQDLAAQSGHVVFGIVKAGEEIVTLSPDKRSWISLGDKDTLLTLPQTDYMGLVRA